MISRSAAHPRPFGSNRPLAYAQPGAFDKLREGPEVNDDDEIDNLFLLLTHDTQQPAPAFKPRP